MKPCDMTNETEPQKLLQHLFKVRWFETQSSTLSIHYYSFLRDEILSTIGVQDNLVMLKYCTLNGVDPEGFVSLTSICRWRKRLKLKCNLVHMVTETILAASRAWLK